MHSASLEVMTHAPPQDTFGQHHMGRCRMQQPSSHNGAATIHIEILVVAVAAAQDLLLTLKKNLAEPLLCPACVMGRHQCFACHKEGGAIADGASQPAVFQCVPALPASAGILSILLMHTCLYLKQSSVLCMPCSFMWIACWGFQAHRSRRSLALYAGARWRPAAGPTTQSAGR